MSDPDNTDRAEAWSKTLAGQSEAAGTMLRDFYERCRDEQIRLLRIDKFVEWLNRKVKR